MPTKKRLVALALDVYVVQEDKKPSEKDFENRVVILDSGERLLFVPWMEIPSKDLEKRILNMSTITEFEREQQPTERDTNGGGDVTVNVNNGGTDRQEDSPDTSKDSDQGTNREQQPA
jgi:signal transduction protein with GAF and PtsI domain